MSGPLTPTESAALDARVVMIDRHRDRPGYPFKMFSEMLEAQAPKRWLIKGILAWGETSAWVAPPGALKSALMAQAAICVAGGFEWHGKRNKGAAGVVYFALERADLVERRLMAHRARMNLGDLPIAVVRLGVDMSKPGSHRKVVETIRHAQSCLDMEVGLVIVDTFAKLIAIGGGDENQAKDQGAVFANLQHVKNATGAHIAIVGHTGKDTTKGARGSNAILGDVDLMVELSGDTIRTATATKANDAPEGVLFSFAAEVHEFGIDEDGDAITVNIVSNEPAKGAQLAHPCEPNLTKNQRTLYSILHDAGPAGLMLDEWNAAAQAAGIGVRRRADLTDNRSALKAKGLVRTDGDRWKIVQP